MGFLNKLFGKKESSLITFKDPKKHPHYYAVGPNGLPNCWKPFFNPEPQEYLVITADAEVTPSGMDMPFCANVVILGYVNLSTGERSDKISTFTFIPTAEEKKDQSYIKKFENFTVYKIKALTAKEPSICTKLLIEDKILFSSFSDIFYLETLGRNLSDNYLERLAEEYKKTVIVHYEEYGDFTLKKPDFTLEKKQNWLNDTINISIDYVEDDETETQKYIRNFEAMYKDHKNFDENARIFIAKFLTTHINKWRSNGSITYYANMLMEEDVAKILQIESIYVNSDFEFEIHYKDHPYFCGRKIVLYYKINTQKFDRLDIEGKDGTITSIDSDGYTMTF